MSLRILVVDDSPITRRIILRALAMGGLGEGDLLEAASGTEALALLLQKPADLMFADINMPEMSGIELVEKIVAIPALKALRVVMVSTERNEARIEHLKKLGVNGYLTKPFRPEDLLRIVTPLLAEAPHG